VITYIILLIISGLIVGALGRLAIPGRDPMSIPMTIAVGIAGSLIGGLIGQALFNRPGGILLAVLSAAAIVFAIRKFRGGSLDDPYGGRHRIGMGGYERRGYGQRRRSRLFG
jgi:uncharacterized membrane protein YeaQ/YmgE (transglycosylase-associated protein family)